MCCRGGQQAAPLQSETCNGGFDMGKYFIAWLLGVPAGLLILIYVFTHLF